MILLGENFPGPPSLQHRECGGGGRGTIGGGFLGDLFTSLLKQSQIGGPLVSLSEARSESNNGFTGLPNLLNL